MSKTNLQVYGERLAQAVEGVKQQFDFPFRRVADAPNPADYGASMLHLKDLADREDLSGVFFRIYVPNRRQPQDDTLEVQVYVGLIDKGTRWSHLGQVRRFQRNPEGNFDNLEIVKWIRDYWKRECELRHRRDQWRRAFLKALQDRGYGFKWNDEQLGDESMTYRMDGYEPPVEDRWPFEIQTRLDPDDRMRVEVEVELNVEFWITRARERLGLPAREHRDLRRVPQAAYLLLQGHDPVQAAQAVIRARAKFREQIQYLKACLADLDAPKAEPVQVDPVEVTA